MQAEERVIKNVGKMLLTKHRYIIIWPFVPKGNNSQGWRCCLMDVSDKEMKSDLRLATHRRERSNETSTTSLLSLIDVWSCRLVLDPVGGKNWPGTLSDFPQLMWRYFYQFYVIPLWTRLDGGELTEMNMTSLLVTYVPVLMCMMFPFLIISCLRLKGKLYCRLLQRLSEMSISLPKVQTRWIKIALSLQPDCSMSWNSVHT